MNGVEPHEFVRSGPSQAQTWLIGGRTWRRPRDRSAVGDGVLGPALNNTPVSDAIALGTFRTRLETRTKESNTLASHWNIETQRRIEREDRPWCRSREEGRASRCALRTPGASRAHCELRRTQSERVGTRKMVNYAWSG